MIINDKALARTLKRSGASGFKLRMNGYILELVGWDWAARLTLHSSGEPPRLTLAALVEMLGYIPETGECGHVYKDKGGWEWQSMAEAVFESEYAGVSCDNGTSERAVLLPIRYGGPLILTLSGRMYRVSGPSALAEGTEFYFRAPNALCFGDKDSELYIGCLRPEIPGRVWTQLEKIEWEAPEDADTDHS